LALAPGVVGRPARDIALSAGLPKPSAQRRWLDRAPPLAPIPLRRVVFELLARPQIQRAREPARHSFSARTRRSSKPDRCRARTASGGDRARRAKASRRGAPRSARARSQSTAPRQRWLDRTHAHRAPPPLGAAAAANPVW